QEFREGISRHSSQNLVHSRIGFVSRMIERKQTPPVPRQTFHYEPLPYLRAVDDAPDDAPTVNNGLLRRWLWRFRFCWRWDITARRVGPTPKTNLIARPEFVAICAPTNRGKRLRGRWRARYSDRLIEQRPTTRLAVKDILAVDLRDRPFATAVRTEAN